MEYILDQDEKIKPGNASTKEMISEPCRTDQCCAASVFEDRLSPPCDRDAAFPRNLNQLPNKKQAVLGYFRQKSCEFGYSEEAEPQILHDDVPIVRRESLSARRYSTTPTEAPSLDSSIATFLAEDIECPKVETTFGSKRIPPDLLCTDDDDQVRYTLPNIDTTQQWTQCVSGICPDEPRCLRDINFDGKCPSHLSTLTQESTTKETQPCKIFHRLNLALLCTNIFLTAGLISSAAYVVLLYWETNDLVKEITRTLEEWHSSQQQ
uniref:Uncharacterized protein n=1 Tax=Ciona savignyi TaxID=51511 RepID=H2ZHA6_CIOSA